MIRSISLFSAVSLFLSFYANSQTKQDSLEIRQVALDYIEAQHNVKPEQFQRAAHPRMIKRTFWTDKNTHKEFLRETFKDAMVLLAETYNQNGDRFPKDPKKEVILLDVLEKTASVKLVADEWVDYMHILKLNGKWQIVNVLWQYKDIDKHGR